MGMTNLYKEDFSDKGWAIILDDMNLPFDTDEICVKYITHITESQRQKNKEQVKCLQQ